MGHAVRFGGPLVHHARNHHDLLDDLVAEVPAIRLIDDVLAWLREHRLDGSDYPEAYESLSYGVQDFAERVQGQVWGPDVRAFLHRSAHLMRTWISALRRSGGG